MGEDNVIPFPGGSKRGRSRGVRSRRQSLEQRTRELVRQMRAAGRTPPAPYDDVVRQLPTPLAVTPSSGDPILMDPILMDPAPDPMTYVVRVDLDGARPPVWRRLTLSSALTLDQLHDVLQVAMGWTDSHLHQFQMGDRRRGTRPFLTDFDIEEGDTGIAESGVRLDQVFVDAGDRLRYTYDDGCAWRHTLRVERVDDGASGPAARCIGGRRAGPPENFGGISLFNEVVAWLADPDPDALEDPELLQLVERLPHDFVPEAFDADAINRLLDAIVGPC